MVKAELVYNPYLMEINIKFNGQEPRINSLVEKYQKLPLQDWINKIPNIFYNEMNGYDFELDFSGTELDCDEVRKAFLKAGVSEEEVIVFLKNELDSRELKVENIDKLLTWLKDNPNRKFDEEEFRNSNKELFDGKYTFITVHGENADTDAVDMKDISIENIENISEIEKTNLKHTPILIFITNKSIAELPADLNMLLSHRDVTESQLFFYIENRLNYNKIKRVIIDLGIKEPEIVSDIFDEKIKKYIKIYPLTDYIFSSIKAFSKEIKGISSILDKENKESEVEGKEIHERIDIIDNSIKKLKDADGLIISRDNLEMPTKFKNLSLRLDNMIMIWRNKKTKINRVDEAAMAANDFNTDFHQYYGDFCKKMQYETLAQAASIRDLFISWYQSAMMNESFTDKLIFPDEFEFPVIEGQINQLMELKEEKYVEQKESIIGQLFKSNSSTDDKTSVLVTTFYYQSWREHFQNLVSPIVNEIIEKHFKLLNDYYNELADVYHNQLSLLIDRQIKLKNEVVSQLSEDEKLLQADNAWLTEFSDQLKNIERS